jgi:hypothetical protein
MLHAQKPRERIDALGAWLRGRVDSTALKLSRRDLLGICDELGV